MEKSVVMQGVAEGDRDMVGAFEVVSEVEMMSAGIEVIPAGEAATEIGWLEEEGE